MAAVNFCGQCGSAIIEADKFCGSCGSPVGSPPSVPPSPGLAIPVAPRPIIPQPLPDSRLQPPVPEVEAETVLGVVPNVAKVQGFLGRKSVYFNLVVTNRRLIFARQAEAMTRTMDAEATRMWKEFEGYPGPWREFIRTWSFGESPWQVYLGMTPDRVAQEWAENISMELPDIRELTVVFQTDPDNPVDELVIKTKSEDHGFTLGWGNGEEVHRVLSQVMSVRLSKSE